MAKMLSIFRYLLAFSYFSFITCESKSSFGLKLFNKFWSNQVENKEKLLLPKVQPHPDNVYLLEFVVDSLDCATMKPIVKRLENDLQVKVRRLNINKNPAYMKLFEIVGGHEGGNVPFFYNRRTARAICGTTNYRNLKMWGMGDYRSDFLDPLETLSERSFRNQLVEERATGNVDYLIQRLMNKNKKKKK